MNVCISYITKISPITFQRHGVAAWTLRNWLLSCISFSWRNIFTDKWFISSNRMYRACLRRLRFLTTASFMFMHYDNVELFLKQYRDNCFAKKKNQTCRRILWRENCHFFWKTILMVSGRNTSLSMFNG